jgi:3,4-dihydroxy 2-butanone 4-phosphate synthase
MEESKATVTLLQRVLCFVRPREVLPKRFRRGWRNKSRISAQPLKDRYMTISKIEDAIAAIARGDMVIVVDDHDRENEGDLVFASQDASPEKIAFMMNKARGLICVSLEGERLDALDIPLMVPNNTELLKTAFTVSVDYLPGTTTGISAADRAATIKALVDPGTRPADFARPGHVFPLRAHHHGVLGRPGHTEAAIDLCRLAGKAPSGVICEIANDDGSMARLPELEVFADVHGLHLVTIADLIDYFKISPSLSNAAA